MTLPNFRTSLILNSLPREHKLLHLFSFNGNEIKATDITANFWYVKILQNGTTLSTDVHYKTSKSINKEIYTKHIRCRHAVHRITVP